MFSLPYYMKASPVFVDFCPISGPRGDKYTLTDWSFILNRFQRGMSVEVWVRL